MNATPAPNDAAAVTPAQDAEENVEEANDAQEVAKKEAKTS